MGIKEQFRKLKDNWLIITLILAVLIVPMVFNLSSLSEGYSGDYLSMADASSYKTTGAEYYPSPKGGFAPDVTERKIVSSAYLSSEIERGEFKLGEEKLKSVITSSGSHLLTEDVNLYGEEKYAYYYGNYQIKVESNKYQAVLSQLKELGEVTSFSESSQDITGSYTNTKLELEAEKSRLSRYLGMYDEATNINDKITLNDRIFDQERTIKYLEESLQNMDQRVEYYNINVNLQEKQSEYLSVVWVKFSELVRSLVQSINGLLKFIFVILPYAALALVVWIGVRIVRKRR